LEALINLIPPLIVATKRRKFYTTLEARGSEAVMEYNRFRSSALKTRQHFAYSLTLHKNRYIKFL